MIINNDDTDDYHFKTEKWEEKEKNIMNNLLDMQDSCDFVEEECE